MAIGPDGRPHFVMEADFYFPRNIGGWGDVDIFYRGLSPAPAPSGANNALKLVSDIDAYRYDNMQVLPSSYLNFTTQMTGEVWVRPYPGGDYTGWAGSVHQAHLFQERNELFLLLPANLGSRSARQAQVQIQTTDGAFYLNPCQFHRRPGAGRGLVPPGLHL